MTGIRQRLRRRTAFSYRDDPAVARFPDARPIIVFDGVCVLCSGFVRFVLRHDRDGRFCFVPAQSALGASLLRHYGLDAIDFETNLLIENGVASGKLDAFVAICSRLGGLRRTAILLQLLPSPLADFLYDRIARNRYRLFGRTGTCMLPPTGTSDRFLG